MCWLVVARLPGEWGGDRIDELARRLRDEHAIDTRPLFRPIHQLAPYSGCRLVRGERSVSADLAARGLCLPSSSRLTEADVRRVCAALCELAG